MEVLQITPGQPGYLESEDFEERAKEWATKFRKYTIDEDVKPYLHGKRKTLIFIPIYQVPSFSPGYTT